MDVAGLDVRTWVVRMCGFAPLARLPEFLIGICLGHWLRARHTSHERWSFARATALEAVVVAMLIGALVALGLWTDSKPWLDSGLLAPLFGLLIVVLSAGSGLAARLLSTRPLQSLGDASYATYILQEPVLLWLVQIPLIGVLPPQLFVPVFVGILIAASLLCEHFIASPARVRLLPSRQRSYDRAGPVMQPS
jgi:peptidoglycan/LPS O-acetylase OafA/YrhL